jgi:acyl-CoA hydrolase
MVFRHPIHIGDLVLFNAEVTYAGRTSMEVEVHVIAENPISSEQIHTNAAYLVYVAIDDDGKPTQIPTLVAETLEEQARMDAAVERQQRRLAQKADHK